MVGLDQAHAGHVASFAMSRHCRMAKSAAVWPKVEWPVTRAELALADSTSG